MSRLNLWKFKIPNDSFLWSSHLGYDIFDIFMWLGSFGIYSPMKLGSSCPVYRQKAQTCGTHCGLYPACGREEFKPWSAWLQFCAPFVSCSFLEQRPELALALMLRTAFWIRVEKKKTLGLRVLKKKKSEHKNSSTHKWVCRKMWTEEKVCKSRHSS